MIVCLYGQSAEPFVTPAVADLQRAAAARGGEITALAIEAAVHAPHPRPDVQRLYVLPFDVPPDLPRSLPMAAPQLIEALFPRAELVNAPPTHELCWDKIAMARRLLECGVPMPDSLVSADPEEAIDFVRHHGQATMGTSCCSPTTAERSPAKYRVGATSSSSPGPASAVRSRTASCRALHPFICSAWSPASIAAAC